VLNSTGKAVFFSLCGWKPWCSAPLAYLPPPRLASWESPTWRSHFLILCPSHFFILYTTQPQPVGGRSCRYAPPDPSVGYAGGASLGNSWRIHGDGKSWGALSGAVNTMAALSEFTGPGGYNDPDLLIGPWCGIDHDQSFCGQSDLQARTQFTLWALFPAPLLISQNVLAWSKYALETYSNEEVIQLNQEPGGVAAVRIAGDDLVGPPTPCADPEGRFNNCTNVWGRLLTRGNELAIAFVNNGLAAVEVHCDVACFNEIPQRPGTKLSAKGYRVRDLWSHTWLSSTNGLNLSATVAGQGGQRLFRLVPLS
jgi:hypothetical protein